MSSLRPAARATSPDGREWEIYAYKLRLRERPQPDPGMDDIPFRFTFLPNPLDGILYVLSWIPRALFRLFVDLPVAVVRMLRSDEWTIEAVSWAPFEVRLRWSMPGALRGQVLATVEGELARGRTPHPRNAKQLLP